MGELSSEARAFLYKLYTFTGADTDAQASMYDVGIALGLEREESGSMAENLFIEEFAELKTLSGGIGITAKGLKALDIKIASSDNKGSTYVLSSNRIMDQHDFEATSQIIESIKQTVSSLDLSYDNVEQFIMDIKCLELHLVSNNPKTSVVKALLRELSQSLDNEKSEQIASDILVLTGD